MAFRDIYTGGACNTGENQSSSQRNANPLRGFMDNVIFDKSNVNQKLGQQPIPQMAFDMQEQIMMREKQFSNMNNEWNGLEREFDQKMKIQQEQMQQQWMFEQQQFRLQQIEQQKIHQQMWLNEQNQHQSQEWANEMKMDQVYEESIQQQKDSNLEQENIKKAAGQMVDVMMQDPDPKFKNSKFLQFLNKVQKGDYEIRENELIKLKDDNTMDQVYQEEIQNLNGLHQISEKLGDDVWEQSKEESDKFDALMEEHYQKMMEETANMDYDKMFGDAWNEAEDDYQQELIMPKNPDQYDFNKENPFLNSPNPLKLAMDLIAKGNNQMAILALEAQLQKNPEDAQAWRILGRLIQENDQDFEAVACLLKANHYDPSNLDTLLALGISCTNTLDEVRAMSFLKQWMVKNPKYQNINLNHIVIAENREYNDYSTEEIKQLNMDLINQFNLAVSLNPQDSELQTSLSVLHFINRDYETAVNCFKNALTQDPANYSLWNKLGATLAHLGQTEDAMQAYHKALDLKPNYVRVWVNLGIAHAYKFEYKEAARFYLNALSLNPQASHLWNYLESSLSCLSRFDLVQKIRNHNLNDFASEFDIIKLEDLPQPSLDYMQANKEFLIRGEINDWVNEFQNQADI